MRADNHLLAAALDLEALAELERQALTPEQAANAERLAAWERRRAEHEFRRDAHLLPDLLSDPLSVVRLHRALEKHRGLAVLHEGQSDG
jgi:hypothetical protein